MSAAEIAMLVGGIVVLVVLLGLLVFCVVKRRPYKGLLVVFPLAVIMIGFPAIKSFKLMGAEVDLRNSLAAVEANPDDTAAKARLAQAVDNAESLVSTNNASVDVAENIARGNEALERTDRAYNWAKVAATKAPDSSTAQSLFDRTKVIKLLPADSSRPLSPQRRANLVAAMADLSRRPNLAAESHLALSRAHLALGQTNEAETSLHNALRQRPNLRVRQDLRFLMRPPPR